MLNPEVVRAGLNAGWDPNARDGSGATLLHYAVLHNKPDVVVLLLDHHADVNARIDARGTETGATPLLYAAVQNNLPLARLLIRRGADPRITYRSGMTALHIVADGGMTEVARLLLQNGADPNARDSTGSSPLDDAAWKGFPAVVALLLESGARVDEAQLKTGATPLNEAAFRGYDKVAGSAARASCGCHDQGRFRVIANRKRDSFPSHGRGPDLTATRQNGIAGKYLCRVAGAGGNQGPGGHGGDAC